MRFKAFKIKQQPRLFWLIGLGLLLVALSFSLTFVLKIFENGDEIAFKERKPRVITDNDVTSQGWAIKKAEGGNIADYIFLFGKVDLHPERAMHLHPKFPGIVREVYKGTGERVRPGEVLARIENNVGVQTFDLVSAINGIIVDRRIAAGQAVAEDVEAFTIADPSLVVVRLVAYAKDLNRLVKGQQVIISVNQVEDIKMPISYVSPVLDENTQSAPVLINVDNTQLKLRPGQFVTGRVIIAEAPIKVRVPKPLVNMRGPNQGVMFVRRGKDFAIKRVQIGRSDRSFLEIIEGLAEGDEYIDQPYAELDALLDRKMVHQHGKS